MSDTVFNDHSHDAKHETLPPNDQITDKYFGSHHFFPIFQILLGRGEVRGLIINCWIKFSSMAIYPRCFDAGGNDKWVFFFKQLKETRLDKTTSILYTMMLFRQSDEISMLLDEKQNHNKKLKTHKEKQMISQAFNTKSLSYYFELFAFQLWTSCSSNRKKSFDLHESVPFIDFFKMMVYIFIFFYLKCWIFAIFWILWS